MKIPNPMAYHGLSHNFPMNMIVMCRGAPYEKSLNLWLLRKKIFEGLDADKKLDIASCGCEKWANPKSGSFGKRIGGWNGDEWGKYSNYFQTNPGGARISFWL